MDPASQTRYCPTCGTRSEPGSRFCKQCGTQLPGGEQPGTGGDGGRRWAIGIAVVAVVAAVAGMSILSHRSGASGSASGLPTEVCDRTKLKLHVWLRAGPDGVEDGYTLGSPTPCRLKERMILYVTLRAADGNALPPSLAGLKEQEIISGFVGVRLAPGLPPISQRSSSFSSSQDWCRVPYKQPWTLTIGSPTGPSAFASAVICQETAIPVVDRRAIPVPEPSSRTLVAEPLCVRPPGGGGRVATATGVAEALRAGELTARAWPGDVGHLYGRLVGAAATGYVTWVPTAAATVAGPFVVGIYPNRAAAARAWRLLGGAQKVANDIYRSGVYLPTQVVAARRANLVYVQLLEGGQSTEDVFYYTMYDAITNCE